VNGAIDIARFFGVSETVIGLTIVAIGTSLPELVTSVMAAWRGSGAVVIGNVVGSNIFNIGAILGITSLVHPLRVPAHIVHIDMWIMAAVTALAMYLVLASRTINRTGGVVMLALFSAFIVSVF